MYFRQTITQENTLSGGKWKETQMPEPQPADASKGKGTEGNAIKGVAVGEKILNNRPGLKNRREGIIINPC